MKTLAGPRLAVALALLSACHKASPPLPDVADLVDTTIGTTAGGNVFPGADFPFGMVQWSPDTSGLRPPGGGYDWTMTDIRGFSLTHISGPGCDAYGDVPILPMTGGLRPAIPGSTWSRSPIRASSARPATTPSSRVRPPSRPS